MKERHLTTRRRFLTGATLSGLAAIGGCSRAPLSREDLADWSDRAESWARRVGERVGEAQAPGPTVVQRRPLPDEAGYVAFLAKLNLRHISPEEVIRPHRNVRDGVANCLPPRRIWSRIAPTLRIADEIREQLGRPLVYINSAYRCEAYNAACSGAASRSQHLENRALDLMFDASSDEALAVAKTLRKKGAFAGGIGRYPSFIHIDTRGYDATWGEIT